MTISSLFIVAMALALDSSGQVLWFGTYSDYGKIKQGRFEVVKDNTIKSIVLAPYGMTPVVFKDVRQQGKHISFTWEDYKCNLEEGDRGFKGTCTCENKPSKHIILREFNEEDAILQGDSLRASLTDLEILDRALTLLNKGNNWDRDDNRICDNSSYPYRWSLFCALHQASIDVKGEYQHLSPAMQAARQAIKEATAGRNYAHLLQDFNNESKSYGSILGILERSKTIITEKMKTGQ